MLTQLMALKQATISVTSNSDDTFNVIVSSPNTAMFSARFPEWQAATIEALIQNHLSTATGGTATGSHVEGDNVNTTATSTHAETPVQTPETAPTDANSIVDNF
ncbi:hypothetical protein [Photobacterium lutimaris]|uniref:Uncharacterized protein n=1 Tax=Photobacterium lutimaris TaxID=388278 RepID=A0A2T3ITG9_9GAMM|nr:hypothetical protein [Photobacterium lutimaris]PSU31660.1 hypothetical protein C9I99_20960 [Photobacterium lutimaris]TDR72706.1 hypothetical protein DFP78_113182 [Photobacterium lutimaris]